MDFLSMITDAQSSPFFGPAVGLASMYAQYRWPGTMDKIVSILSYVLVLLKRPEPEKAPQS